MAYSKDVLKRARERLAVAKADRESLLQQHLSVAYSQVPRLAEIDRLLRQTMAAAIQAAFAQGADVQSMVEQVKQENLALQNERKALIDTNFAPGYLDETPICDCCGGSKKY